MKKLFIALAYFTLNFTSSLVSSHLLAVENLDPVLCARYDQLKLFQQKKFLDLYQRLSPNTESKEIKDITVEDGFYQKRSDFDFICAKKFLKVNLNLSNVQFECELNFIGIFESINKNSRTSSEAGSKFTTVAQNELYTCNRNFDSRTSRQELFCTINSKIKQAIEKNAPCNLMTKNSVSENTDQRQKVKSLAKPSGSGINGTKAQ